MTQQDPFKIVQYWANYHLVVSGNHCRSIDNCTQKNLFQLDASPVFDILKNAHQFLTSWRAA